MKSKMAVAEKIGNMLELIRIYSVGRRVEMKGVEMLRKLTANPFHEEYKGIYTQIGSTLVPLTTAKPDGEGNLIFFHQNKKTPMTTKTLFAILLMHKNMNLYRWNNSKIAIYSYRIDHGKIIV